jgi:hypothetical protein
VGCVDEEQLTNETSLLHACHLLCCPSLCQHTQTLNLDRCAQSKRRGLSAAATAGGLGTASLTSREPEALPFCALSYALVGIFSTVFMSVPAVRAAIVSIVA